MRTPGMDGPRQSTWILIVTMTLVIVLPVGLIGIAAWSLWIAWQGGHVGQWADFWSNAWDAAKFSGVVLCVATFLPQMRQSHALVAAVRRGALEGGDTLAPLAEHQPEPPAMADVPTWPVVLGPLDAAESRLAVAQAAVGIFLFLLGVLFSAVPIVVFSQGQSQGDFPLFLALGIVFGAVTLTLLGGGLFLLARGWRSAGGVRFAADEWGIAARHRLGRRGGSVPWHEIRAFYAMSGGMRRRGTELLPGTYTLYCLDTGKRRLQWIVRREASDYATIQHRRLCNLITVRTGLPLRDASIRLREAAQFYVARKTTALRIPVAEVPVANQLTTTVIPSLAREQQLMTYISGACVLLSGLLLAGGWALQHLPAR